MLGLLFIVLVLLGFVFWFVAILPAGQPWAERTARGLWLGAAVIWALQAAHS